VRREGRGGEGRRGEEKEEERGERKSNKISASWEGQALLLPLRITL
jgi:hypothetical protein